MTDTILAFRVTGRVQGVWFRAWTRERAEALGLRGWVRNEADGAVAGLVAGEEERVREMVRALHEGPPAARVARVETSPGEDDGSVGFRIRR